MFIRLIRHSVFLTLLIGFSWPCLAAEKASSEDSFEKLIVGTWNFYKVFYDGTERPPFSPNLQLYFQFAEGGSSHIFYYRVGEKGFCERKGHYYLDQNTLVDKVTWVNSNNGVGCGQDPDMRLGNETRTQINFQNGDLHLYLGLSGEPLIYIWRRVEKIPVP